jgi:hypothetical protein
VEGYGMLIYDDLKMEKIAQAKLMNELKIERVKLIELQKVDKREIRKVVLSDSISNLSLVENNFAERDAR